MQKPPAQQSTVPGADLLEKRLDRKPGSVLNDDLS